MKVRLKQQFVEISQLENLETKVNMKLLQKFLNIKCFNTGPITFSISQAVKCEEIADLHAIEFGKWLNNQVLSHNGTHQHLRGKLKTSELYYIFKNIKGL